MSENPAAAGEEARRPAPKLATSYLGLDLAHPLVPGASPLAADLDVVKRLEDAGAAAIVMHSLFEEQLIRDRDGTLRAYEQYEHASPEALSYLPKQRDFRMGPERYLEQIRRIKETVRIPVIASLNGVSPQGWLDFGRSIEWAGADAIEINTYQLAADPTVFGLEVERRVVEIVALLKGALKIPVAVKLGPYYSAFASFACELERAGADGLVLFNRFYQPDFDIDTLEVRPHVRLSDSSELPLRLRWLAILSPLVKGSLACTGGVHSGVDALKAILAGAHAVQVTSALLRYGPEYLGRILSELKEHLERLGVESLSEIRASLSLAKCADPTAFERAGYMRVLQSWRPDPFASPTVS